MRRGARRAGVAGTVLLSIATGACSLLVGDDLAGGRQEPAGDAGIAGPDDAGAGAVDADAASLEAAPVDASPLTSGILVRGTAKALRSTTNSIVVTRPPGTQVGDVLLVVLTWKGTLFASPFTTLGTKAGCPPPNDAGNSPGYVWWGYRTIDAGDPPSWTLSSSNTAAAEAIFLALSGATAEPLDDSAAALADPSAPVAPSVRVQHDVGRVLAAFAAPTSVTWPTPPGLTRLESTAGMAVFTTLAPRGTAGPFAMPEGVGTSCVTTMSLALAPQP